MQYIIWGCGVKARAAVDFIGMNHIAAFIDSNESLPDGVLDKPIISFTDYLKKYRSLYIIVTPNDNKEIIDKLAQYHIKNYSILQNIVY